MSEKRSAQHTFLKGLQTDKAIINTTNEELSDALNVVLTTAAANQFTLQSESGNIILSGDFGDVSLPEGFRVLAAEQRDGVIYFVLYNPSTNTTQLGTYPSPAPGGLTTFRQTTLGRAVVTNIINDALYSIFTPVKNLETGVSHEFLIERANGTTQSLTPFINQGPVDLSGDSLNRDRIISIMSIDSDFELREISELSTISDPVKRVECVFISRSAFIKGYAFTYDGQTSYVQYDNPGDGARSSVRVTEIEPNSEVVFIYRPYTDFGFLDPVERSLVVSDFLPEFELVYVDGTTFRMTETAISNFIPETFSHSATIIIGNNFFPLNVSVNGTTYGPSPFTVSEIIGTNSVDLIANPRNLPSNSVGTLTYAFTDESGKKYDASVAIFTDQNGDLLTTAPSFDIGVTKIEYQRLTSTGNQTASFDIDFTFKSEVKGFISYDWLSQALEFVINTQSNISLSASLKVNNFIISNINKSPTGNLISLTSTPAEVDHNTNEVIVIRGSLFVTGKPVNADLSGSANFSVRLKEVLTTVQVLSGSGGSPDSTYDSLVVNVTDYNTFTTPLIQFTYTSTLIKDPEDPTITQ